MPSFDLSIIPTVSWNSGAFDSMPKPAKVNSHLTAEQGFDHKTVPAVQGYTPALQRKNSISPLFPGPEGAMVTMIGALPRIYGMKLTG